MNFELTRFYCILTASLNYTNIPAGKKIKIKDVHTFSLGSNLPFEMVIFMKISAFHDMVQCSLLEID
jgi:hypothetical protein